MRTKADMLNELKVMLYDALLAKTRGVTYPRLARAHGYVDGYMKALLDAGLEAAPDRASLRAHQRGAQQRVRGQQQDRPDRADRLADDLDDHVELRERKHDEDRDQGQEGHDARLLT